MPPKKKERIKRSMSVTVPPKKKERIKRSMSVSGNGKNATQKPDSSEENAQAPEPPMQALAAMQNQARLEVYAHEEAQISNRRAVLQREIGKLETSLYEVNEKITVLDREAEGYREEKAKRAEVILELERQRERIRATAGKMIADQAKHEKAEAAVAPSIPAVEKIPANEGGT